MTRESRPEASPKREQILAGARALFLELGYERASVDAIAARAGVSKATVYNHFRDKEALFLASFGAETEGLRQKFHAVLETPTGDIEGDLRTIGTCLLGLIAAPGQVMRHRTAVAEADRFPELGQRLHECGQAVGRARMARYFARAGELGLLEVHDPMDAAIDFASLCVHDLQQALLLGRIDRVDDAAIAAQGERAGRTFLRAYLPR